MKNSFSRDALKWGVTLACLNFVISLVLPMSNGLDPQAMLILSPVTGFVGGVAIHFLNFLAVECVRYSKYRLAKVEGSKWNNIHAILRVEGITVCGQIGGGVALTILLIVVFSAANDGELIIVPLAPLLLVIGFGFGALAYFSFWALGLILSYLSPRTKPLADKTFRMAGKLTATLKKQYNNWKNHDYRQ